MKSNLFLCVISLLLVCAQGDNTFCSQNCDCSEKYEVNCVDKGLISLNIGIPSSVENLILSKNSITQLNHFIFLNLSIIGVKELFLDQNSINFIGRDAFKGMTSLWNLDLSSNRISQLDRDTFASTIHLYKLNISSNPLNELNRSFLDAPSVWWLMLRSCNLSYLSPDAFDGLPNLRQVDLSNNKLIEVEPNTFNHLREFIQVYIYGNPLQCGTELDNLIGELKKNNVTVDDVICKDTVTKICSDQNQTIDHRTINQTKIEINCSILNSSTEINQNKVEHENNSHPNAYKDIGNSILSLGEKIVDTQDNSTGIYHYVGDESAMYFNISVGIVVVGSVLCVFIVITFVVFKKLKSIRFRRLNEDIRYDQHRQTSKPSASSDSDLSNSYQLTKLLTDD